MRDELGDSDPRLAASKDKFATAIGQLTGLDATVTPRIAEAITLGPVITPPPPLPSPHHQHQHLWSLHHL
ncbi:MAG: hypothetical protein HC767_10740 [Akkermansiaceae bacterium]|nr:hypothetical protein [Akkermansiaceae bacterium]